MVTKDSSDVKFEIGHVLFIDVVGYSRLRLNEQCTLIEMLNQVVVAATEFQRAEQELKLVRLPTRDGMALVFYTTPEAPAKCALEISRALRQHPELRLRMGVPSGPAAMST